MKDELDDLRAAWQDQSVRTPRLGPDAVRHAETRLERGVRNRNLREGVAAVIVFGMFGWLAFTAHHVLEQLGSACIALAAVWIGAKLARHGRTAPRGEDLAVDGLTWQRTELHRERALLDQVWRWYLGPLVPGMVLFLAGSAANVRDLAGGLVIGAVALFVVATFLVIGWVNARAVRKIDAELASLDG